MQRPFYRRRRFWLALVGLVGVVLASLASWLAEELSPAVRIGMSVHEVQDSLGSPRDGMVYSGVTHTLSFEFQNGQVVVFDPKGRVVAVRPRQTLWRRGWDVARRALGL